MSTEGFQCRHFDLRPGAVNRGHPDDFTIEWSVPKKVYIIGSLRNPKIPEIANAIRAAGFEVFDDWHSAGEKADDGWKEYEAKRGRRYKDALDGYSANTIFNFDLKHIQAADIGVLVLPAGKSGHLELGYMRGRGQQAYVLFEEEPDRDRWDLMYKLAHGIFFDVADLVRHLKGDPK